ncbi:MAG TPA: MobF family relaxase [Rugosimonospora sp.]|nr:MobF family relaxase [Rugosimonospora sp.]
MSEGELIFYYCRVLTITKMSPGVGSIRYLMDQIARGRLDFRPAPPTSAVAYYADPTAHGEAPPWWAGAGADLLGVRGFVSEEQMRLLVAQGKHPVTEEQLGQLWRTYTPMTDAARREALALAVAKLPADATVEQRAKAWLDIMTAPDRTAVAAYDVTVSPVKSVSLLWAFGDDRVKGIVMAAHHSGVRAVLAHLQRHGAFTRAGTNGIRQLDTAGLAAMVADHRMSREKDPQLHSHIVVSAKVRAVGPDGAGRWLALDGRALYAASIGARAAYERAVEVHLRNRLGVRFGQRPGSQIREVIGISLASVAHYSKRRAAIEQEMGDRCATTDGRRLRVDNRRWRRRAQDASLRTRRPKHGAESTREAQRRWHAEDRAAGLTTAADVARIVAGDTRDEVGQLAARAVRLARRRVATVLDEAAVADAVRTGLGVDDRDRVELIVAAAVRMDTRLAVLRAVRDLADERAVFGREHLELALGRLLEVGKRGAEADWHRVQRLAQQAVARGIGGLRVLTPPALVTWGDTLLRASDRESVYTRHRSLVMTTAAVLAAEHEVIGYAALHGAATASMEVLEAVAADLQLSVEKRQALLFAVGDDRRITGIIGPAGAGKTYLQRAVAHAGQRAGVPVLGLTVGQNAAEILADSVAAGGGPGIRTENIAMWLHAQSAPPTGTTEADWAFAPGQWVIVDEASQASSHDLARLVQLLHPVGGKLLLVGDPAQISAVGPGGLFRYLAGIGAVTELTEIHRFADSWEGPASLRLRTADTTVLAEYDHRARLVGGHRDHLIAAMIAAWTADTLAGRDALMLTETEAEAADLAAHARRILIRAGRVTPGRSVRLGNGTRAGVGDRIVTRHNDRRLLAGNTFVANRDQWRVLNIGPDGQLHVENLRTQATTVLPTPYVATHVQLAYAGTVDAAQGRTVQVAHSLVDDDTTRERLYVMLTRGQLLNLAYVVVDDKPKEGHPRHPPTSRVSVLADILRRDTTERSATETQHQLWADVDALHHWAPVYDDLVARAQGPHWVSVVRAAAGPAIADRTASDPALPALSHLLNSLAQAGYNPDQILADATGSRELLSAEDVAAVLVWRIRGNLDTVTVDPKAALAPAQARSYTDRAPIIAGEVGDALRQVAHLCDQRVTALAELAAQQRPDWTIPLGPPPDDAAGRRQWLARTEIVAAFRDRYQITSRHPIGPEPNPTDVGRWSAWYRAHIMLGMATLAGRVAAADDIQLQTFIDQLRAADAAAPTYVGDQLRADHTAQMAAQQHLTDIQLELAAVEGTVRSAARRAMNHSPRWWHIGGSRTRAAAAQAAEQRLTDHARQHADALRRDLTAATAAVNTTRGAVTTTEDRHEEWTRWYHTNLPTRYAGLAAAAERTRRLAAATADMTAAISATAAKVRAIPETQPRPHTRPVPDHLAPDAEAGRDRVHTLHPDLHLDEL